MRHLPPWRDWAALCAVVAIITGVIGVARLLSGCAAAQSVPKPIRVAVEKVGCDEAATQIADQAARAAFLSSCYGTAELFGRHANRDAGVD